MSTGLGQLVREKQIIVCCGAGGVGKTTTAAALALAGARFGRRVLVLTIDPSKRLAETLGVERNPPKPVRLPPDRLTAAEIAPPAFLEAWMLDPKLVADESVRRLARTPEDAERFLSNRIYQHVTDMIAGMHEYTAMEALHRLVLEGKYDLVILDTPPARNALDFLEAPSRLSRFLDGKIFQLFLPKGGILRRATSAVVSRVLQGVFGPELAGDLTTFFGVFAPVFNALNRDVVTMRAFLSRPEVAFLLVTSPAPAAVAEVHYFQDKTKELGLPFRGFVLNRSRAITEGKKFPEESLLEPDASPEARSALGKLKVLATYEQELARKDLALLGDLTRRAGPEAIAVAVPELRQGASDMTTLLKLADVLSHS